MGFRKSWPHYRFWTGAIIAATVAGLILWDLVIVFVAPPQPVDRGATISRVILDWAQLHPFIPLGTGALIGHWMWPEHRYQSGPAWKYWLLGAIGVAAFGLDIVGWLPQILPLVYVGLGVPLGHYLWPQRVRL